MQAKVEFVVPNVVPISISFLSLHQRITNIGFYVNSKNSFKKRENK